MKNLFMTTVGLLLSWLAIPFFNSQVSQCDPGLEELYITLSNMIAEDIIPTQKDTLITLVTKQLKPERNECAIGQHYFQFIDSPDPLRNVDVFVLSVDSTENNRIEIRFRSSDSGYKYSDVASFICDGTKLLFDNLYYYSTIE